MNLPENVLNPSLYIKAKETADKKYKRHGAYKNMFLVSEYKRLGGKYSGKKPDKKSGLSKWIKEEWVQVLPYLETGEKVICGSGSNKKGCRPLKKMNDKTPITLPQLIKIHGKEKLINLAKEKRKNMDTRINWKLGKIY